MPNIDYLATKSPKVSKAIIDVDLNNDNTWLIDNATYTVFGALGVCGIIPCPGHRAQQGAADLEPYAGAQAAAAQHRHTASPIASCRPHSGAASR
jgi:hypothetical protein